MQATITDINQLDLEGTYTYADYLKWRIKERIEIIRGKIFRMSPAPNTAHQRISTRLLGALYIHFKGSSCDLFSAPFDVRLFDTKRSDLSNQDIYTVVQPDLCIVCDSKKLDSRGCIGAPDLMIEILSPGNSEKEMNSKFKLYQDCGVREYWIVDPQKSAVLIYVLNEESKYVGLPPAMHSLSSTIFPDLKIDLEEVFQ
ncbi:Uma2 family endonuclease [Dyadobacter sp. CY343]|uniref:Uma2 family endonuclease n=1 Tax=Dyadobacter sp. CY343 TaxID=2907299 RepID=UPI001F2256D8|nr:Uma2 family endonuclease [Dyadobacter sp. CY343]MCE7061003.1 Uma2 family endonuclease [Dyadobacter sp. CY343]